MELVYSTAADRWLFLVENMSPGVDLCPWYFLSKSDKHGKENTPFCHAVCLRYEWFLSRSYGASRRLSLSKMSLRNECFLTSLVNTKQPMRNRHGNSLIHSWIGRWFLPMHTFLLICIQTLVFLEKYYKYLLSKEEKTRFLHWETSWTTCTWTFRDRRCVQFKNSARPPTRLNFVWNVIFEMN